MTPFINTTNKSVSPSSHSSNTLQASMTALLDATTLAPSTTMAVPSLAELLGNPSIYSSKAVHATTTTTRNDQSPVRSDLSRAHLRMLLNEALECVVEDDGLFADFDTTTSAASPYYYSYLAQ